MMEGSSFFQLEWEWNASDLESHCNNEFRDPSWTDSMLDC